MSLAKTLHHSWENWHPVPDVITHAMTQKQMQLFFFSSSTFRCLDLSSFSDFFLSTPAKQPWQPGSLCLCKNINFYLSLFSFFRGHPRVRYQISYPNTFGISPTAAYKYLGISYYFFEAPANHDEDPQVSLHSLERHSWVFSLFPKNNALVNNKICAFTYS